MNRLKSIGTELGLLFLLAALAPIFTAYFVANNIFGEAVRQEKREALVGIADATQVRIESYVLGLISDTTTLARSPQLVDLLRSRAAVITPDATDLDFLRAYREGKGYFNLLLVDQAGVIRFSLKDGADLGQNIHGAMLGTSQLARSIDAANTLLQTEVSNFAFYPPSKSYAAFLAAPVFDAGVIIGNVVLQIDNRELNAIVNRYGGLGESGEVLVATEEAGRLIVTAPTRHDPALSGQAVAPERFRPLSIALRGDQGSDTYVDHRGRETLVLWRYLPSLNWGMVVKSDTAELDTPIHRSERITFLVMLASVSLVLLGVLLSNQLVSRPIMRFARTVRALDQEALPEAVEIEARHEIRELVAAFNTLIANVRAHQQELEQRVARRTAELADANAGLEKANLNLQDSNRELADTLAELRKTQSQLIESEKLAALGQLIAGIAHEINTPLGSIASSIDTLATAYRRQDDFLNLYADLPAAMRAQVAALLRAGAEGSTLSLKEKRDLKKNYEMRLTATDVDARKAAELFSHLKPLDIVAYLPLLTHARAGEMLEHVKQSININRACQNIRIASEKARKVVFALKNFAHYDHQGEKTPTGLRENIETVLTLYHNQIKQAVDLHADLPDLPPIPAYADELGQVWMNLIHNALQAMDYKGRLEITLEQDATRAVVRIADSGCGIPEDVRERIFQPFFTTKPAGEGSGLGLDIVAKIVAKHGGTIRVESQIGQGSTFEVTLPAWEETT